MDFKRRDVWKSTGKKYGGGKNKQISNYKHNKLVRMVFNMPTVQTHWEETVFNWYIKIQIMEFIIWKSGSNIVIEKSRNIKSKTSDLKATYMLMKQRHFSVKYKMVWWRASIWWMVDIAKNNISWRNEMIRAIRKYV